MALDLRTLPPDSEIYTQDEERLGRVKEIRNDYLLADVSLRPDYWRPLGLVASFSDAGVTMSFDKDHLEEHESGMPGEGAVSRSDTAPNL